MCKKIEIIIHCLHHSVSPFSVLNMETHALFRSLDTVQRYVESSFVIRYFADVIDIVNKNAFLVEDYSAGVELGWFYVANRCSYSVSVLFRQRPCIPLLPITVLYRVELAYLPLS